MRREHNKRAGAHEIAALAVDLDTALRVVGHAAVVLLVLGIAEENDALDLLADGGVAVADGGGGQGGALAVAAGDDLGAGALCVGHGEEVLHLGDGGRRGAVGQEVVEQAGRVGAADALDPDVGRAEVGLERVGGEGAEGALFWGFVLVSVERGGWMERKTYEVAALGGATGKDEDDGRASRSTALLKLVPGRAALTGGEEGRVGVVDLP